MTLRAIPFVLSVLTIFLSSCDPYVPTTAKIHVTKNNGTPVENAEVNLSASSDPTSYRASATTNSNGDALFNFDDIFKKGQAGVAILDIDVTKDNLQGEGVIKIEEEKDNEKTVVVQ